MALRNTLSTSAYLPTSRAAPQALACHHALVAFFGSPALAQLCRALLTRALLLTPQDVAEYDNDPEAFVHVCNSGLSLATRVLTLTEMPPYTHLVAQEESVARETEGLRKCAERCLQTLADIVECRQQVQQAVLGLCAETAAAGLQVRIPSHPRPSPLSLGPGPGP